MKERKFSIVRIILIAVLSVVALLAIAGFVACSSSESSENESYLQAPVYQGMTISHANQTSSTTDDELVAYAANVSGDIAGKEASIDSEKPFGDGSVTIEQQIEQKFKVTGAGQDIYYADLNEDILITVRFSNPYNYQILSFAINGQIYTSYMFQDGSDMENIVIKLNVGSVAGFNEYTISEIKYIDGTEIKDALLNGDTSVKCGVRGDEDVRATVSDESVSLDTISLSAKIMDLYSLVEESDGFIKAVLYDGAEILEIIDLEVGNNEIEFTNLYPNTLYQYAIVAVYDDLSGNGTGISYLYKKSVYTEALVLFKDVEVTKTGVSFAFEWYPGYDDNYLHTKFTLEDGSSRLTTIDPATEITGLLSDHEYTLNVAYTGFYGETEAIRLTFTTLAMEMPELELEITETTKTSISYIVTISDEDGVGERASVKIYCGDEVVYEGTDNGTGTEQTLDNLMSGDEYRVVVSYSYDLNDGEGERILEISKAVSTQPYEAPSVEITLTDSSSDALTFSLTCTDNDNICTIESIDLYKEGELIDTLDSNSAEFAFTNLPSYTLYTLVVSYSYDLNDGEETRHETAELSAHTDPAIAFSSVEILNTSAVKDGEDIRLSIDMVNPDGVTFTSVVINGTEYAVSSASSSTNVLVNISNDGQYEGGDTKLVLTRVTGTIDGAEYSIDVTEENNFASIFIYGALYSNGFTIVSVKSGEEEERLYKFTDDELYYKIEFTNGTGYEIVSVTIDGVEYSGNNLHVTEDGQTAYVAVPSVSATGWTTDSFTGVRYVLDDVDRTNVVDLSTTYVLLSTASAETVEISSAEQLKEDLTGWKYYKLTSDIDLSGTEWLNIENSLEGVFDGNGHKIYNAVGATTISDEDLYLGIFKSIDGVVTNIEVCDVVYSVTLRSSDTKTYDVYAGGLAATSGQLVVVDSRISSRIQIANETGGTVYIGALSGSGSSNTELYFVICELTGDVTSSKYSYNGYLGNKELYNELGAVVVDSDCTSHITFSTDLSGLSGYIEVYIQNGVLLFSADKDEYTLAKYLGTASSVTLPSSIDGNPYNIGDKAFYSNGYIEEVLIPDCVTSIGNRAFYGCTSLTKVTIPKDMVYIGNYAFYNCESLMNITIPENVSYLGDYAFGYCTSLEKIEYDAVYANPSASNYVFRYAGVEGDTILTVGSKVECIPAYSFYDSHIAEIVFEEKSRCEIIGEYAFYKSDMVRLSLPDSLISIGRYAFYSCSALTDLTIGASVENIENYAFSYCYSIECIYFKAICMNDLSTTNWVFDQAGSDGDGITVVIDKNVSYIPAHLFNPANRDCGIKITEVIFQEGSICEKIGDYAFAYCTDLSEINIPDTVVSIGASSFITCTSLTCVTISEGVTYIGRGAFWGCTSLTEIHYNALNANTDSSVSIYDVFPYSGTGINTTVTIGANVKSIPAYLFDYSKITSIVFDDNSSCEVIGEYAFSCCTFLTTMTIPENVVEICDSAFSGCTSLTSLTISDSVQSIGKYAFWGCRSLTEIIYRAANVEDFSYENYIFAYAGEYGSGITVTIGANVTYIPAYLFCPCSYSSSYPVNITGVIFEEGSKCTSIGNNAFSRCTYMTEFLMPNSVTSIGNNAFNYCTSLTIVYYSGTADDWSNISIGSSNSALTGAARYYYSKYEPSYTDGYDYWHYVDGEIVIWTKED